MDADRVVIRCNGRLLPVRAPVAQVEDVGLDKGQEASPAGLFRDVRLLAARVVDHPEEVAAQGAHRGEQAVAPLQVEGLVGGGRPEPVGKPSHLAVGVDEVPVLPAGVHDEEVDVDGAGDGLEDAEMEGRQGRDAEYGDPRGQRLRGLGPLQAGEGLRPARRPVQPGACGRKQTPEGRLPVTLPARLPSEDHLGTVHEVLVEQPGDDTAELVALEPAAVVGEVGPQGLEPLAAEAAGQKAHDPPGEHLRVERRGAGQVGDNGAEDILDEMVGEREPYVGADPQATCQLQREPPLHAAALDQDDLRGQGRGRGHAQGLLELAREGLETVAGVELQAGHDPRFTRFSEAISNEKWRGGGRQA